ncbi:hypothetical protein [Kocuria kalidii]|uniref:hypothetical protein n=1 Tax=Kocuria kalidii TaxID=3376283 RepID=UPI0037B61E89
MADYRTLPPGTTLQLGFLKQQVKKGALMTTLLSIARRASTFFELENFMAREYLGDGGQGHGSGAPEAAGADRASQVR